MKSDNKNTPLENKAEQQLMTRKQALKKAGVANINNCNNALVNENSGKGSQVLHLNHRQPGRLEITDEI
jgi:hypothetical protein